MCDVGLDCLSYYIPPASISVDEYGAMHGLPDERVRQYRDVQGVTLFKDAQGETATEIASKAAKRLMATHAIDPNEIDALILYHTRFFTSVEPVLLVGHLARELGLRRAVSFSVWGQFCVSILSAIRVARNMIRAGSANVVLLVGADTFLGSYLREIDGITLQGEGGSAFLLRKNHTSNRLVALATRTDGSLYKGTCASREEYARFDLVYFLSMTRVIHQTLAAAKMTLDDIAMIIPHNVNRAGWERIVRQLKCPASKLFGRNIPRLGHMFGVDLVVNLADALETGAIGKGDRALLATAGMGANWGCAIVEC